MNDEFNLFVKKNDELYQKQKEINGQQKITNENQIKNIDVIIKKSNNLCDKINEHRNQIDERFLQYENLNNNQNNINEKINQELNSCLQKLEKITNDIISLEKMNQKNDKLLTSFQNKFNSSQEDQITENKKFNKRIKRLEFNTEIKRFEPIQGHGLFGIINYLNEKTGGNIHVNKTINIQSSSNKNKSQYKIHPSHLCNFKCLNCSSMWSPNNEQNSYLLYDFKTRKIKLTNYSFRTPTNSNDYPKSWIVECSNDNVNWTTVDNRNDEEVMNSSVCHTFECQNRSNEFYRYIKIMSKGPCWSSPNNYYFDLAAIEFFGVLNE